MYWSIKVVDANNVQSGSGDFEGDHLKPLLKDIAEYYQESIAPQLESITIIFDSITASREKNLCTKAITQAQLFIDEWHDGIEEEDEKTYNQKTISDYHLSLGV